MQLSTFVNRFASAGRGCVAMLGLLLAVCAQAQSASMKWIVPYPAGGTTDLVARVIAERMSIDLGQSIVIENRPGAGTRIGTDAVSRSAPDGNTLLFTNTNYSFLPIMNPKAAVDPIKTLAPVSLLSVYGMQVVVSNSTPAKTLTEFIEYAKKNPGKLSYGSAGAGTGTHFFGEYFKSMTGTMIVHIPYKSTGDATKDVARGEIALALDAAAKPLIDSGHVRLLAVTGSRRDPRFPGTPTAVEAGLEGFVLDAWSGLLAPAATPPAVLDRINKAANVAVADAQVRRRLAELGMLPHGGAAELLKKMIDGEITRYQRVAAQANIKLEP